MFCHTMKLLPLHLFLTSLALKCFYTRMVGESCSVEDRHPDQGNQKFHAGDQGNIRSRYVGSHFRVLQDRTVPHTRIACIGGETRRVHGLDMHGMTKSRSLGSIADLVRGLLKVYALGEVDTDNCANVRDHPAKSSGIGTMDIARVEARDPIVPTFSERTN